MKIEGIICALITPLGDSETVDCAGTARLAEHVLSGGVNALLALGSTGEQTLLADSEKVRFLVELRRRVPSSVPLIAGTGDCGTRRAIQNARQAEDAGADALLVTPPTYYPFGDSAVIEYYEALADAVRLPLCLYNISRFTGVRISETVLTHLKRNPRFAGMKDSDRDMEYFRKMTALTEDAGEFNMIQGSDRLFAESFAAGARAAVSVTANVLPEPAVSLYRAFRAGKDMTEFQKRLLELVSIITGCGCYPVELKYLARHLGLCGCAACSPLPVPSEESARKLVKRFEQFRKEYGYEK